MNIEKTFHFQSKLFIKPERFVLKVRIAINLLMVVVSAYVLYSAFTNKINITKIAIFLLMNVIVKTLNKSRFVCGGYEDADVYMVFYPDKIILEYFLLRNNMSAGLYETKYTDIQKIDYSDQLQCLHLEGPVKITDREEKTFIADEQYIYLQQQVIKDVLKEIRHRSGSDINYLDRK